VRDLGTILGVWAHPDDEGYLSAAIMANAVQEGRKVCCITATRGEAADPERWPPADLAKIREAELARSLGVLGVTDHRWLDYADGGCAAVDPDEAAARVAAVIDEIGADTVLTFGPEGQTGHSDHIAVSDWCVRAVARAERTPALYFATNTPEWVAAWAAIGEEFDIMMDDVELPATPRAELAVHVVCDGELLDLKERAMCAQASQVLEFRARLGPELYRELLREEAFRSA
jgi:LmbE family N-acetylglucosaminyl deacetylase